MITPHRPVAKPAQIVLDKRVNRLPVGEKGRLVGVVTRSDLVRGFARPDDALAREIREDVLEHALWLRDPRAVHMTVDGGKVTLEGAVDRPTDAELVSDFAAKVPGVVEVESSLRSTSQNGQSG